MKYDYFKIINTNQENHGGKQVLIKKSEQKLYKQIVRTPISFRTTIVELGLEEKELYKHTMLEEISFDLSAI